MTALVRLVCLTGLLMCVRSGTRRPRYAGDTASIGLSLAAAIQRPRLPNGRLRVGRLSRPQRAVAVGGDLPALQRIFGSR